MTCAVCWVLFSFDTIRDGLGGPRSAFPHELYLVAGTQAATAQQNSVTVLRLCNLGQAEHGKNAREEVRRATRGAGGLGTD